MIRGPKVTRSTPRAGTSVRLTACAASLAPPAKVGLTRRMPVRRVRIRKAPRRRLRLDELVVTELEICKEPGLCGLDHRRGGAVQSRWRSTLRRRQETEPVREAHEHRVTTRGRPVRGNREGGRVERA